MRQLDEEKLEEVRRCAGELVPAIIAYYAEQGTATEHYALVRLENDLAEMEDALEQLRKPAPRRAQLDGESGGHG